MSTSRPNSTGYRRGSSTRNSNNNNKKIVPGMHQEKRQIVGQYMIGKTIGEGTFGKVKLAVHIPTGEKVAVKILEKNRIKEQADVRRVNREIKILKKARHGNVIQLYEVLDTRNTIYLIMECAEGGEMFDYIVAHKRVEEQQACKFLHQIIDGLEVLHNNDITHRDLKPEATPDGWVVKIVDFGLSNTHEGGRLLTTACGSPCYAAPEMIAGKKYVGPLADLWSTGVILFALVSGYLPFEDPNTSLLYKKILAADYKCPKWISSDVKNLIGGILETDPAKRFTISNIRNHNWYRNIEETDVPHDNKFQLINNKNHKNNNNNNLQQLRLTTHNETLISLKAAGMDTQIVLDSVISHAFNSFTAMYYLLEQKYHNNNNKNSKKQIRQNSSNLSKPETSETNDNNTTTAKHIVKPPSQPKQVLKFLRPNNNNQVRVSGVSRAENNDDNNNKGNKNNQVVSTAPYLQTPRILQSITTNNNNTNGQHNSHHRNSKSNNKAENQDLGNLEQHMGIQPSQPIGKASNPTKMKAKIPLLSMNNTTTVNKEDVLISQTSRQDNNNNSTNNHNHVITDKKQQPVSARAELPSIKPKTGNIPNSLIENSNKDSSAKVPSVDIQKPTLTTISASEQVDSSQGEGNVVQSVPLRKASIEVKTGSGIDAIVLSSSIDNNDTTTAVVSDMVVSPKGVTETASNDSNKKEIVPHKPEPPSNSTTSTAGPRRGRNISFSASTKPASNKIDTTDTPDTTADSSTSKATGENPISATFSNSLKQTVSNNQPQRPPKVTPTAPQSDNNKKDPRKLALQNKIKK